MCSLLIGFLCVWFLHMASIQCCKRKKETIRVRKVGPSIMQTIEDDAKSEEKENKTEDAKKVRKIQSDQKELNKAERTAAAPQKSEPSAIKTEPTVVSEISCNKDTTKVTATEKTDLLIIKLDGEQSAAPKTMI